MLADHVQTKIYHILVNKRLYKDGKNRISVKVSTYTGTSRPYMNFNRKISLPPTYTFCFKKSWNMVLERIQFDNAKIVILNSVCRSSSSHSQCRRYYIDSKRWKWITNNYNGSVTAHCRHALNKICSYLSVISVENLKYWIKPFLEPFQNCVQRLTWQIFKENHLLKMH